MTRTRRKAVRITLRHVITDCAKRYYALVKAVADEFNKILAAKRKPTLYQLEFLYTAYGGMYQWVTLDLKIIVESGIYTVMRKFSAPQYTEWDPLLQKRVRRIVMEWEDRHPSLKYPSPLLGGEEKYVSVVSIIWILFSSFSDDETEGESRMVA